MPGLAIKLGPRERVLINGVMVENGPRRAQLVIKSDNAAVLRMREAIAEEHAIGPASRAYLIAQRAVTGVLTPEDALQAIEPELAELGGEAGDTLIEAARANRHASEYYRLMRRLRTMIDAERAAAGLCPLSELLNE